MTLFSVEEDILRNVKVCLNQIEVKGSVLFGYHHLGVTNQQVWNKWQKKIGVGWTIPFSTEPGIVLN